MSAPNSPIPLISFIDEPDAVDEPASATPSLLTIAATIAAAPESSTPLQTTPPKRIFIVPYRNRPQHKFFFSKYMSFILENRDDYEIYFAHQCDPRPFNRGAVKNIGFLAMKHKYPEHYRDITFIFNDVDTIPFHRLFDYDTTPGIVKHYYGFEYALGGIVAMRGGDFERINGFPCYWGWGMEDNALQNRCERAGLQVDRSVFYKIGAPEMLQLFDGISRIISKKDPYRMRKDNGADGLRTMSQLKFQFDRMSTNPADNQYAVTAAENPRIWYINILTFLTQGRFEDEDFHTYDLREPRRKIVAPDKLSKTTRTVATTDDWSHIPYYATMKENRENAAKKLVEMGRAVPHVLMRQIEEDRRKELAGDIYNQPSAAMAAAIPPPPVPAPAPLSPVHMVRFAAPQPPQQPHHQQQQQQSPIHPLPNGGVPYPYPPATTYQAMTNQILAQQIQRKRLQTQANQISRYSPMYAKAMGIPERASKSAHITLGGIAAAGIHARAVPSMGRR